MAEGTAESLGRALVMRHRLDTLYTAAGDQRQRAVQLNGIGNIYYLLGAIDSAVVYYRSATEARRAARDSAGLGRTLGNLGNVYSIVGATDSAFSYYHMAREIARSLKNRADESAAIGNLSALFITIGQLDSAIFYGNLALELFQAVGDREGEGQTLHNLGLLAQSRGMADSARSLQTRALDISKEIGNRPLRAAALTHISTIFNSLGVADSALAYAAEALAEYEAGGDVRSQGQVLNNIGIFLSDIGQFDSASVIFRRALDLSRASGDRAYEASALLNLGAAEHRLQLDDSALVHYAMSLAIRQEIGDKRGEALTLANIAGIVGAREETDSALVLTARAALLFAEVQFREGEAAIQGIIGEVFEKVGNYDSAFVALSRNLSIAREIRNRREESGALNGMARIALKNGQLSLSHAYFDSAVVARTMVSRQAGDDFNRVGFADTDADLFGNWTLVWLQRTDVDSSTTASASLAAYEKGRTQALLDLMGDSTGQAYVTDMGEEGRALARNAGGAFVSYGFLADSLVIWFSRDGNDVQVVGFPVKRATLSRLISDLRSSLGAQPVSDRSPSITRAGSIGQRGSSAWTTQARRLADILMPERVRKEIAGAQVVTIVPAGELALLPFSLIVGDAQAIRYAPSLATLGAISSTATKRSASEKPLVIGDPDMPTFGSDRLPQLPAARQEASAVSRALGTQPLVGSSATETAVRARLASAPIIHLATHGLAYSSRDQSRKSFVALASDQSHDGLLTVGEILEDSSLRLNATLVVLSACETAVGDISDAEGTIGFQRALFAKGANGVLLSLWKVSDEATSLLMQRFYEHWRGPRAVNAAEALHRAQNDVRTTRGFEHPRYWSAFQLAGDPDTQH